MVVVLAEGAADERRARARQRFDLVVAGVYVCDDLVGGERIEVVVRVGVVFKLVAALDDGPGLLGVLVGPVAHDEERARHAVFFQHVENFLRVVRAPGGVEGDGTHLLVTLHAVDGQLPRCRRGADGGGIVDGGEHGDDREPCRGQRQPPAPEHEKARRAPGLCSLPFGTGHGKEHLHILLDRFW